MVLFAKIYFAHLRKSPVKKKQYIKKKSYIIGAWWCGRHLLFAGKTKGKHGLRLKEKK
jgi:hypothetical protein